MIIRENYEEIIRENYEEEHIQKGLFSNHKPFFAKYSFILQLIYFLLELSYSRHYLFKRRNRTINHIFHPTIVILQF